MYYQESIDQTSKVEITIGRESDAQFQWYGSLQKGVKKNWSKNNLLLSFFGIRVSDSSSNNWVTIWNKNKIVLSGYLTIVACWIILFCNRTPVVHSQVLNVFQHDPCSRWNSLLLHDFINTIKMLIHHWLKQSKQAGSEFPGSDVILYYKQRR